MDENQVIETQRIRINEIDEQIIKLLNERMNCAVNIGKAKKTLGMNVYNPQREQAVIDNLIRFEIYPGMVKAVWQSIMDFSKTLQ